MHIKLPVENLWAFLPDTLDGEPGLVLRPATVGDEPRQRQLFDCLRTLAMPLPPALLEQQWRLRQRAYAGSYPHARTWMLETDGEVLGTLTLNLKDDALRIVDIGLWPHWQGRGLGSRVLHAVLDLADARQLTMELAVLRHNPALRLYQRLGFCERVADDPELGPTAQLEMIRPAR